VISGLGIGGAESSLVELVRASCGQGHPALIICATDKTEFVGELEACGARVVVAAFDRRMLSAFWSAANAIRAFAPEIIQGWMYHGIILASILARLTARSRVVWSIRHSISNIDDESRGVRWALRLARLPWRPDLVVYNSQAGADSHRDFGFARWPSLVVGNGVDVERFRPDAERRRRFRSDIGAAEDDFVIGYVGRNHPHKDLQTLFDALARVREAGREFMVAVVGARFDGDAALADLISARGLGGSVKMLGVRRGIEAVYPGFDLVVLSSRIEGTPNVILEAMASGVDVAATNAGDSARLVDDVERIAPVGDASRLAAIIEASIDAPAERRARAAKLRQRAVVEFSAAGTQRRYQQIYCSLG